MFDMAGLELPDYLKKKKEEPKSTEDNSTNITDVEPEA